LKKRKKSERGRNPEDPERPRRKEKGRYHGLRGNDPANAPKKVFPKGEYGKKQRENSAESRGECRQSEPDAKREINLDYDLDGGLLK